LLSFSLETNLPFLIFDESNHRSKNSRYKAEDAEETLNEKLLGDLKHNNKNISELGLFDCFHGHRVIAIIHIIIVHATYHMPLSGKNICLD
jgi:hypothetical protein